MATIVENIQTLQSIKSDIKSAILEKGGSVTDAFGGYAQAIKDLPSGGGRDEQFEALILNHTLSGVYSNRYANSIGSYQFGHCSGLTEVNFPNVTNIGEKAFVSCTNLKSIYIPNCESVHYYAFNGCASLENIDLPKARYIGSSVFYGCRNITSVNLTNCVNVSDCAFYNCGKITSLILSECVFVGPSAFNLLTNDANFSIPNRLVINTSLAFHSTIYNQLSDPHKMFSSLYPTYSNTSVIEGDNYGITSFMIKSNRSLIEVNLPECWYIGISAFYGCYNMTSVNLPNVSYIYSNAFYNCYNLPSINLPNISYIYSNAFYNCSKLSIITLLADSVCYIENTSVFYNTSIKSTTGSIIVPASLVDAYKVADGWSDFKDRIFPYEG